jgi:hypothetical protein
MFTDSDSNKRAAAAAARRQRRRSAMRVNAFDEETASVPYSQHRTIRNAA